VNEFAKNCREVDGPLVYIVVGSEILRVSYVGSHSLSVINSPIAREESRPDGLGKVLGLRTNHMLLTYRDGQTSSPLGIDNHVTGYSSHDVGDDNLIFTENS
jgi:hypothetical protein